MHAEKLMYDIFCRSSSRQSARKHVIMGKKRVVGGFNHSRRKCVSAPGELVLRGVAKRVLVKQVSGDLGLR